MELTAGLTIGAYRLIAPAGSGGMADVWRAYHPHLKRYVAIKFLSPRFATDQTYLDRFLREAQAVSRLDHPNILTIYDYGEQDGWTYMVSPFIGGGTLAARLRRGAWTLDEAVGVLDPLASALDYAHGEGIVHRDVKPSNILFTERDRLILSDFGIARMLEATSVMTGAGLVIGTPLYMAPEQADGKPATAASDRYSLGVVAYEMVTGRPPFDAETPLALLRAHIDKPLPPPRAVNPTLPEEAEGALFTMLAKNPDDRYPSCAEFVAELRAVASRAAVEPEDTEEPAGPPAATAILADSAGSQLGISEIPSPPSQAEVQRPTDPSVAETETLPAPADPFDRSDSGGQDAASVVRRPDPLRPRVENPTEVLAAPGSGRRLPRFLVPLALLAGVALIGAYLLLRPADPATTLAPATSVIPTRTVVPIAVTSPSPVVAAKPSPSPVVAQGPVALPDIGVWNPTFAVPSPAPAGTVLLREDFDDPSRAVLKQSTSDAGAHYRDGALALTGKRQFPFGLGPRPYVAIPGIFGDASIALDVTMPAEGGQCVVEMACRILQEAVTHYTDKYTGSYMLRVRPGTGTYWLQRRYKGGADLKTDEWLPGGGASAAIRQGTETNRFELTCAGDTITASANGTELISVRDRTFRAGTAQLSIDAPLTDEDATVRFDNLVVTQR